LTVKNRSIQIFGPAGETKCDRPKKSKAKRGAKSHEGDTKEARGFFSRKRQITQNAKSKKSNHSEPRAEARSLEALKESSGTLRGTQKKRCTRGQVESRRRDKIAWGKSSGLRCWCEKTQRYAFHMQKRKSQGSTENLPKKKKGGVAPLKNPQAGKAHLNFSRRKKNAKWFASLVKNPSQRGEETKNQKERFLGF